jgi:tripartite-type tricarboxylate transporter receptor subunit TctC
MRAPVVRALRLFTAALALGVAALAHAQPFPSKPIKVVVPYPVGGAVDVMTRLITSHMQQTLGQPVIVENRPGANANIGPDVVSKAAPDGYTVLATATYLIANPLVETGLRWTPKELVPVARFTVAPNVVVVPGGSPSSTVQALVAAAKARPGELNYGEAGPGAPQTMAIEMLKKVAGIDMQSVMYKGSPPVIADLINETLSMSVLPLNVAMGAISGGRIKALASTSNRRSSLIPDVPTMAEVGYPDVTVISWYGLHVPAGTPPEVIAKLSAAVRGAAAAEEVRTRTAGVGGEIAFLDTAAFDAFLREDEVRWQKFVGALKAR